MAALATQAHRARVSAERLARKLAQNPALLKEALAGLGAQAASIRFSCAKALRMLSQKDPELLYPTFGFFAGLLHDKNKILQWEAARILAELARVDPDDKWAGIFKEYFAPVRGPVMITAATVIQGGARVAQARPEWAGRIAAELLKVQTARYQSTECRNVAIGHAILALDEMRDKLPDTAPVLRFVRRQLKNPRAATRKKAETFLRRARKTAATDEHR